MALHHRNANGGKRQVVDTALHEAVFAVTESPLPESAHTGEVRQRSGAGLPVISSSNTHTCGDGGYVVIGGNSDGLFKRLMRAVERPDLADDASLAHSDGRVLRNDEIDGAISAWTRRHSLDEVVGVLKRAEAPVGKICTAADIHLDPHYRSRGMIERATLPDDQPIGMPGIVPKLSATPGQTAWVGPSLGSHLDGVLSALGIGADTREALRRGHAV